MSTSEVLNLPYIMPAQAQKHVTHNEAVRALDVLVQLAVSDKDLTAPPPSPDPGAAFIVPSAAMGEWAGRDGQIAAFQDGAWLFYPPNTGWIAHVADEGQFYRYDGSAWGPMSADLVNPAPRVGVNAVADDVNRLTVSSEASVFSHDGDDHQMTINKAAPGDIASVLFQTSFSGRAEAGLVGDNNFRVKVSADGAAWTDAIVVDKDTGFVGLSHAAPDQLLHLGGANPSIRLEESAGSYLELSNVSGTQSKLKHTSFSGQSILDISTQPEDESSDCSIRIFRDTSTSGECRLDLYVADQTPTYNHRFQSSSHTFLNAQHGWVKVGGSTQPEATLDVDGAIRVGSYAVDSLPNATPAGQLIYVSDETGGAVIAFSDGNAWRRATDRSVVN